MQPRARERRSAGMRRPVALVIAFTLPLSACSSTPTSTPVGSGTQPGPTAPELASGVATQGDFTLSVVVMPAVAATNQVIEVTGSITNGGPEPLTVSGPGSGVVFFSVTRLEDGVSSGPPVIEGDCTPHEFPTGEPVDFSFKKSGAFTDEDADAGFRRSYFADPELRLPPGTWRIDISTAGVVGEQCRGEPLEIELSLVRTVAR